MKEKIISFLKKQWLLVWLFTVSVALFGVIVYAEYPGVNNYIKRVVTSDDSADMMFSSNLLNLTENNKVSYQPIYVKQLTENDVAEYYDVDVYVWNYDINGSGDYYKKQITYDLEISIVDAQGNNTTLESGKVVRIMKNDANTYLATFSGSSTTYVSSTPEILNTNGRNQNKYTIRFSKNWSLSKDVNKRVMIKAIPTSEFTDLKTLVAAIGLREESSSESTGWKYYINEKRISSTATLDDYDAYNLVLSGTGSEQIIIEWNTNKVKLNKDFYESNGAFSFASGEVTYHQGGGENGWDQLIIEADSYSAAKEYRNRYDIQIYKESVNLGNDWNFIGSSQGNGIFITVNVPTDSTE